MTSLQIRAAGGDTGTPKNLASITKHESPVSGHTLFVLFSGTAISFLHYTGPRFTGEDEYLLARGPTVLRLGLLPP